MAMKFKLPWTICRVCLREGKMHSLFLKDNMGMTIAEKLNLVADVKIESDKKLPEEICRRCMILLNSAFELQIRCKKSDFLLQLSVKHKEQLDRGKIHSALILTLNNGKIYTMPKDVTLKTKSAVFNTSSQHCIDSNSNHCGKVTIHLKEGKVERFSSTSSIRKNGIVMKNDPASNTEPLETASNISTNEEIEQELRDSGSALAYEASEPLSVEKVDVNNSSNTNTKDEIKSRKANDSKKGKPAARNMKFKSLQAPNSSTIFVCELCGNWYKSKVGFDLHMRIHRNERPYKCEICSASFVQSGKLTTHMRRHTGERPYQCNYCSRRFLKKEAKLIHERMHTGEKPYECNVCNKKFSYTSVLARHKVLHSNEEKIFECIPCGKRFRFKYHLVAHLKTSSHRNPTR